MDKPLHNVFLGLGSNLDNPQKQIHQAIESINTLPATSVIRRASLYQSAPVGPQDQPDYVNTAVQITTTLSPSELLSATQQIETSQGRVKLRHWGERCIDIDILLFDLLTLTTKKLIIPHSQLIHRDFVLIPLLEISPDIALPSGNKLTTYLAHCPNNKLQKIEPSS